MASVPALLDAAAASSKSRSTGNPSKRGVPRTKEGEPRGPRGSNERRTPGRRNANVELVAEDETGIIESVMEGFGFIKCADRDTSLFFHFSELKDHNRQPEVGDELMFAIGRDNEKRRELATRIDVLPKGSVVFEVVEKSSLRGCVIAPLQTPKYDKTAKRRESFGGKVSLNLTDLSSEEAKEPEIYEFSERDLVDAQVPLREGDEVEFDVFIEKRSGKTGATRIVLLKPCPTGRLRGVVKNVVASSTNDYGFIDVEDDERSLFFPLSELIDKTVPVEGTELEFAVTKDRNGKDRAVSITVLPPGTVKVWKVTPGNKLEGVVTTELPRGNGKPGKGIIEVTNEDGTKDSVSFSAEDIHMKTKRLLKGDGVRLRVATRGATEPKRGRDIEMVREAETDREKGVVVPGKTADRIWITCETRRAAVSMATAEVPSELVGRLKPGAEIEFTIVVEPHGRPCAIRPKELPKGSVVLVEIGADVLEGVVVKELVKKTNYHRQANYEPPRGLIRVNTADEKKASQFNFGEGDLAEDEKFAVRDLFLGDKVKFRLKSDKQSKRQSATQIQLVSMNSNRATGLVTKDSGPSGKVMVSGDRFPGHQLPFQFNSVLDPQPLQVGDCVEFDLRKDGTKDYVARLSRLAANSVVVEDTSNVVRGVVESVGKEGGTILVEGEGPSIHPATLSVPVIPKTEPTYLADRMHPATLLLARGRSGTLNFWHDDARPEGRAITLAKGDLVNLVICSHVADPLCRRAIQISARPKAPAKKSNPVTTKRSMGPGSSGGFTFLRTSQIQAIQQGKAIPGDDTDDETDDSGDAGSKPEE